MTNHDSTLRSLKQALMWKILGDHLSDFFADGSFYSHERILAVNIEKSLSQEQLMPLKEELDALGEDYSLAQVETKESETSLTTHDFEEKTRGRIRMRSACLSYTPLFYEENLPLPNFPRTYWAKKLPQQTKITPTLSYAKNKDNHVLLRLNDGLIFSVTDMPYAVPRPKDIKIVISLPYSSKEWQQITPEAIDKALKENMSEFYQHMLSQVPLKDWFFGSSNPKEVYAEITDIFFDTLGVKGSDKVGIGNKGLINSSDSHWLTNAPYHWKPICLKDIPDIFGEYTQDHPWLVIQESDWTPELKKNLDSFAAKTYMDDEKMQIFFTDALHPFNPMNWAPDHTYTDVELYKEALIAWDD